LQTGERTTSKTSVALALASLLAAPLLAAPAWSQIASGGFAASPYQEPPPRVDAANPYASGENVGSAYGSRGENRNSPADPYLSLYRYGTTKPDGLGERYAPSTLDSAPANPDLSMYRYGTRSPGGLSNRYRSGDLSGDPYDLGADGDLIDAGLSPPSTPGEGPDVSDGADELGPAYPYPPLLSANPSGSATDGLGLAPSAPASDEAGANDANSAWVSAPRGIAGNPLALKNPMSTGRAPKLKRGGKPADAPSETNAGERKSAIDGPLGFDLQSMPADNPVSSARKATAAGSPIPAAPPQSGALAPPLPTLPSSVGPSSVGPSVPGGPSP